MTGTAASRKSRGGPQMLSITTGPYRGPTDEIWCEHRFVIKLDLANQQIVVLDFFRRTVYRSINHRQPCAQDCQMMQMILSTANLHTHTHTLRSYLVCFLWTKVT